MAIIDEKKRNARGIASIHKQEMLFFLDFPDADLINFANIIIMENT